MSWNKFEEYIKSIHANQAPKICLVIGAGIHRLLNKMPNGTSYEAAVRLSSWNGLMDNVNSEFSKKYPLPLVWELSVQDADELEMGDSLPTHKKENKLLQALSQEIKSSEDIIFANQNLFKQYSPLIRVLNSGCVSDVISLNFDLIAERLFSNAPFTDANQNTILVSRMSANRILVGENNHSIRFWHPHGDRTNNEQLILGPWRYGQVLVEMNETRNTIKQDEKMDYDLFKQRVFASPNNWLELMMFRPLVFLGTGLDQADLTMWHALLIRQRNYAKAEPKSKKPKAWRLGIPGELDHVPSDWILSLEAADYPNAWAFLEAAVGIQPA